MLKFQNNNTITIATFEDFILTAFVIIDELYFRYVPDAVSKRRNVLNAKLSDSEIITISICGELIGVDSENAWFSFVKKNYHHLFPGIGSRSRFNRTRRALLQTMNILALQYPDSGKLSTDVPDVDTGIDWLVYLARYSQQCQAQSHFVVRSRLDIVENTEIMVGPNQSFYCGTLRPDCRPFRTGIFKQQN